MTEKMISRRCAVSLFGLAAALGFAVPTTMLTTSDAEAQAQPSAPATPAPGSTAPATSGSATPGMERRHAPHASLQERLEARRAILEKRREAQRTARTRREARRSNSLYMKANEPTKQK
jgi:hypothetical protein